MWQAPAGNSILSTVFVKSLGAGGSVQVNWYDFAAAADETPPGRYDLESHPLISAAPFTSRIVVNKIHADCLVEIIVAGADAEVGFYVSAVADFPVELDLSGGGVEPAEGTVRLFPFAGVTTPATEIDLIDETVPAGKKWRLRQVCATSRAYGKYSIMLDADEIGAGTSGAASENVRMPWTPYYPAPAGSQVLVKFTQTVGPAMDIKAFLQITELDA